MTSHIYKYKTSITRCLKPDADHDKFRDKHGKNEGEKFCETNMSDEGK